MKEILAAIKDVFLSYSPGRSFIEAMMKFDFKVGEVRTHLMQLCFSNLASWPLIPLLFLLAIDPFKFSWSLAGLLSDDNPFVLFLLDGRMMPMLVVFAIFFVFEWIFRKEYLLLALVFYFLGKNEMHVHLATMAVFALYLSRICYLWWLSVDSVSETKVIWKSVSGLQFLAWIVVLIVSVSALDYIQINYLFSKTGELTRFNFLCIALILYQGCSHLFLSFWGHFYFKKKLDPSKLPTYFSTANWILRFSMSDHLRSLLKARIVEQLKKHEVSASQFEELKISSPGLGHFSVGNVISKETEYLKEASLRISKN